MWEKEKAFVLGSAKIRRWTKELYSISTSSDTFSSIISDGYVREEDELKPHS
ncbi:uncharacterized protein PHALS_06887 [Plasmopara halstedii]|uniref:Uncharacterized protein n=1 Tax=Plasmopara halstedii TaxID=4781 RepID=A0A0P1B4P7_PLAHL|nr:uncharacterized protein PHALS_06887 [Plasmopara halstedii]CEG49103.1 hypothetical protein PHALS_06887 [Plasmopara halstedii]|eukprot:XP_024585472.1 hypothetical protein PHALS_06887 [Plasmopara halstedii]